jgi:hypothetical protein
MERRAASFAAARFSDSSTRFSTRMLQGNLNLEFTSASLNTPYPLPNTTQIADPLFFYCDTAALLVGRSCLMCICHVICMMVQAPAVHRSACSPATLNNLPTTRLSITNSATRPLLSFTAAKV